MEGILEGTATRRLVFIVSSSKSAQFSSPSSVCIVFTQRGVLF